MSLSFLLVKVAKKLPIAPRVDLMASIWLDALADSNVIGPHFATQRLGIPDRIEPAVDRGQAGPGDD